MLAGEPDRFLPADDENMFVEAGGGRSWVGSGGKVKTGGTDRAEGARGAEGIFRKADEGTEFHQGLIVSARIFFGNEGSGDGTKLREGWGTASTGEESTQNSSHVSVEGGCGDIECDAGNRTCGVVAYAWKLKEFFWIGGESALGESEYRLGEGVKKAGTAVVPESLPVTKNKRLGRSSKCRPVRKTA
jgi:hypothetical protein